MSCLLALSSSHTETLQMIHVHLGCFCSCLSIFFPRAIFGPRIIHFNSWYSKSYPESCRCPGRQIFMVNFSSLVIKSLMPLHLVTEKPNYVFCLTVDSKNIGNIAILSFHSVFIVSTKSSPPVPPKYSVASIKNKKHANFLQQVFFKTSICFKKCIIHLLIRV